MKFTLDPLIKILSEMSPYLLLGFFIAGILHVFVPNRFYHKYLGKSTFSSVLYAALFGIPLPLCSCGVIPVATSLRKEGASKGATTSFLIATPQTGVDSIIATYSILGLPFAIIRPIVALVTSLLGGTLVNIFDKNNLSDNRITDCDTGSCKTTTPPKNKFIEIFRYGFVDMLQDVGKRLVFGLIVAALITVVIPDGSLAQLSDKPLLSIILVLLVSVPMYVCATGSIPIAAALMLKGLTPGAALVMLMAGPAINIASILVVSKVLGKKSMIIYLISIIIGAVASALVIDYILPVEWFSTIGNIATSCCTVPIWKSIATILFILLLINALTQKYIKSKKRQKVMNSAKTFKVYGMSCNHCKASVERAISKVPTVTKAEVDLASKTLYIEGEISEQMVKEIIEDLGFTME